MNLALFFLEVVGLHVVFFRLFSADYSLTFSERNAAAITGQFLFWTALSFLLGFGGFFRLDFLVNGGLVLLVLGGYLSFFFSPFESPGFLHELRCYFRFFFQRGNLSGALFAGFGAVTALYWLALGIRMPVISWDALSYHLGTAVHMYQDGDFRLYPGESFMTSHFARGVNLLMSISIMISGGIIYVNSVQWLIFPVLFLSLYSAARSLGCRRDLAAMTAVFPLVIPVVAMQSALAYADLMMSGWVVVAFCAVLGGSRGVGPGRIIWMFSAAGLALAAKLNAAPLTILIGMFALALWRPAALFRPGRPLFATICGFLLAASVALPWPVRNWVQYGSPVYPVMLTGSRDGLESWEYPRTIARRIAEPDPYYDMPLWRKTWLSWSAIDVESWRRNGLPGSGIARMSDARLHDGSYGYSGDALLGGNGAFWILVIFPAMLALGVLAVFFRRFFPEGRSRLYAGACIVFPFAGYFLVISPWWARFSLFLPVCGLLALGLVLEKIRQKSGFVFGCLLLAVLAIAAFDWSTALFQNRSWEKIRRNTALSDRPEWPAFYYETAPLFPFDPDPAPDAEAIRFLMRRATPGDTVSFWTPRQGTFTGLFVDEHARIRQFLFPSVWPDPFRYSDDELLGFIKSERIRLLLVSDQVPEEFLRKIRDRRAEKIFDNSVYKVYEIPVGG